MDDEKYKKSIITRYYIECMEKRRKNMLESISKNLEISERKSPSFDFHDQSLYVVILDHEIRISMRGILNNKRKALEEFEYAIIEEFSIHGSGSHSDIEYIIKECHDIFNSEEFKAWEVLME
jgi:hypothetical protein